MRTITTLALALTLMGATLARAADDPLDAAIALYMSASYEDALAALSQLSPAADLDQADKYRALCLLGLNRPQEAATTIDKLITRKPLLKIDESDSPKLVVMLREAQTRLIPGVARSLFATAKQDFERGQIAASASEFRQVVALITEVGHSGDATLADLKMLADGFGKLADQQLATPQPAAPVVENDREARSSVPPPDKWKIYDAGDTDVSPPIALAQRLPVWAPRDQTDRNKYSGTVEVVIDEYGNVTTATITAPVLPSYDQLLLQAAKSWRYKPARRAGQPVKYRRAVAVLLTPKAAT